MDGGSKIRQDLMAANQVHTRLDIRLDIHLHATVDLLGALLKLASQLELHIVHLHRHHIPAIRPLSTVQKLDLNLNLNLNPNPNLSPTASLLSVLAAPLSALSLPIHLSARSTPFPQPRTSRPQT